MTPPTVDECRYGEAEAGPCWDAGYEHGAGAMARSGALVLAVVAFVAWAAWYIGKRL